ncbi:MAG: DHH family phosphoesterase [Oscillospiraceae bacterium]|nr:DHH family phosphoesterase [Oscillospiraceae bacterium]
MTLNECAALLCAHDDFLILTHTRPDGDTIGSAGALCSALRRAGKTAALYPNPEITEHYLPHVAAYLGEKREGGYVVSVDVAGEEMFPRGFAGGVDLSIDHHPKNPGFARDGLLLDGGKASCGEIVMEVIEALNGELSAEEADLLYMALSTDCGCFVYGNTRADTHLAAAHLIERGARVAELNRELFRSFSFSRLKLEGMIFAGLRSYHGNALNLAVVTLDMMARSGATEDDCDDLASLAGRVRGNRVAITVRELPGGKSKASLRTDGSVDASEVCGRFGGGGHRMASGCTVEAPPEELAQKLLDAVNECWPA